MSSDPKKRMFHNLYEVVPRHTIQDYSKCNKEDIYLMVRQVYMYRADCAINYPNYTIDWFLDGLYLFQDVKKIVDPPYSTEFAYKIIDHYVEKVNEYWNDKYPEKCYPYSDPRNPKNPKYKK